MLKFQPAHENLVHHIPSKEGYCQSTLLAYKKLGQERRLVQTEYGASTVPLDSCTCILKPTANWSTYIFTLVQKVKHRVYKIYVFFLSEAMLC